jgi:hypothetical protein
VVEAGPEKGPEGADSGRIASIDALRGTALVFMVGSHLSLTTGWFPFPSGWGFAVFVLVSGGLYRSRPFGRRYRQLVVAALVSAPLATAIGLSAINVLMAWAIVLPVGRLIRRWPVFWQAAVAGAIYVEWFQHIGGTNIGYLMILWLIGRSVGIEGLRVATSRWPEWPWLMWVGRHPLTVYVGHLALLFVGLTAAGGI